MHFLQKYSYYISLLTVYLVFHSVSTAKLATINQECSLNGIFDPVESKCFCDQGWKGDSCEFLSLAPVEPRENGMPPGVAIDDVPTWGGAAAFEDGKWHLILGSRARDLNNNTLHDYPCDSKIIHVVSDGSDVLGPYSVVETLFKRSSWEPGMARNPVTKELVLMFFGNMTNPPSVGSEACIIPSMEYNLTTTNTYISVSKSGSIQGPWSSPQLVKGMENQPRPELGIEANDWNCASSNPSPAFHPNGTLYAAMRHNPCWHKSNSRTKLGIFRADDGWDGEWTRISPEPIFGWGDGSIDDCPKDGNCPTNEDPHLWWDERGAHILAHDHNNEAITKTRGSYGWSLDGIEWNLTTPPMSNSSVYDMDLKWTNGTVSTLARRQRPSFIRDLETGKPIYLITGTDFNSHPNPNEDLPWCEGCHWGTGVTLIQPLV